jgi:hypothetical protein
MITANWNWFETNERTEKAFFIKKSHHHAPHTHFCTPIERRSAAKCSKTFVISSSDREFQIFFGGTTGSFLDSHSMYVLLCSNFRFCWMVLVISRIGWSIWGMIKTDLERINSRMLMELACKRWLHSEDLHDPNDEQSHWFASNTLIWTD